HEWNKGKIVTFIVTLAATRSVTLAAREAGMSRKSAYALKARDAEFADCWKRALGTRPQQPQGGRAWAKRAPPAVHAQGDGATLAASSILSTRQGTLDRELEDVARDHFFARLGARLSRSPSPA
ncbi:MAG TPA: hypothetical protein VM346_09640, partial [Sphingomicrobium sp.]|nr:hypothetical protein [Sphingomicrobium sp.]